MLSSTDGTPGMPYGNAYTGFFTFSQAFDTGKLGVDRVGFYVMAGAAPTSWLTTGGTPIAGSGGNNKGYSREGFVGQFYFGEHADVTVVTQHGSDSAWFGQGYGDLIDGVATNNNTPGTVLLKGAQNPTWNGVLIEPHYVISPQMILIGRYETLRMSQQSNNGSGANSGPGSTTSVANNLGNISTYTLGYRYNPFMTSRAGFAYHGEYNWFHQNGTAPDGTSNLTSSELLFGIDFDF